MSDEEAFNELRRVAGLENKSAGSDGALAEAFDEPLAGESFSDASDVSAEATNTEELADLDVHGRARGRKNTGRG